MKKLLRLFVLCFVFGILVSCEKENNPPKIQSTTASPQKIKTGETTQLTCVATDPDGDQLTYSWSSSSGTFPNGTNGSSITWKSPDEPGTYTISVIVNDGRNVVNGTVDVEILQTSEDEILQTSEVEGYVYYSGTLIPVSGVTVSIGDVSFTTGESGHFLLQNIAIGNSEIKANKLNFDNFSKSITVNETANSVNIEMTSDIYTHNVSGYISDEDGKKLSGVVVSILNPDRSVSNLKTTSDAGGYYQLPSVPQGSRVITFEKQGYQFFQANIFISNSDYQYSVILIQFGEFTDPRDGGIKYNCVAIGNQVWMTENLAYLPAVHPSSSESYTEPRYYVYDYQGTDVAEAKQRANYTTFGVLYNWPAAMAGASSSNTNPSGVQGICPSGWHLPSDSEWQQLEDYLIANGYNYDGTTTDNKIAKSLAAKIHWVTSSSRGVIGNNLSVNNSSGFSALPGGFRYSVGTFASIGYNGYWWSSTEDSNTWAGIRGLHYNSLYFSGGIHAKEYGFSVRCVKD